MIHRTIFCDKHKFVRTFQILKHRTLYYDSKGKDERIIAVN